MRKFWKRGIACGFVLVFALAPHPRAEGGQEEDASRSEEAAKDLDRAARRMARALTRRLPKNIRFIAVSHFLSPDQEPIRLGRWIAERLITEIAEGGQVTPVERDFIFRLNEEFKFNLSGAVPDDSLKEAGKFLGADGIVVGSIQPMGASYSVQSRLIETETGRILHAAQVRLKRLPGLSDLAEKKLTLVPPQPEEGAPASPASPESVPASPSTSPVSPSPASVSRDPLPARETVPGEEAKDPGPEVWPPPSQAMILENDLPFYRPSPADSNERARAEREEWYRQRQEEIRQAGQQAESYNREVRDRPAQRERQVEQVGEENWQKMQRNRREEMSRLSRNRFIVLVPRASSRPVLKKKEGAQ